MQGEERLDLQVERLSVEAHWRGLSEYMPMSVAAAITFHQVHGNTKAIVTRADYEDALSIAAVALSRLIAVYRMDERHARVAVAVDVTRQRFVRGATQLRSPDGSAIGNLSVKRSDMVSAVSLIKRAGLPFSFTVVPAQSSLSDQAVGPVRQNDDDGS